MTVDAEGSAGRRTWSSSQIRSSISLTFGQEAPCRHAALAEYPVSHLYPETHIIIMESKKKKKKNPVSMRDVSSMMAGQNTRTRQAMQEETRYARQTHG